ncbi:MAG: hypothetical protein LJE84_04555 [Gammaproteobacteria bacterium]|nr:hypothetical protein [Gammaproteobacteria bacterium]
MNEVLLALVAVAIPWMAGALCLRAWLGTGNGLVSVSYGYLLGIISVTVVLRIQDAAGLGLTRWPVLALAGLACIAAIWKSPPRFSRAEAGWLVALPLLALIGLRLYSVASENLLSPLLQWDAWAAWAPKAKVWFAHGELVPFVGESEWWQRGPETVYTIEAWYYPPAVPLVQVWQAIMVGRFDEALVNLPWLFCLLALVGGFAGQARALGVSALHVAIGAWILVSLPLLDSHAAWAGNADLWMATAFALAAFALYRWLHEGDWRQLVLAILTAAICTQIKVPGYAWVGCLALTPILLRFPVRYRRWLIPGLVGLTLLGVLSVALYSAMNAGQLPFFGDSELRFHPESLRPFFYNFFIIDNWHLLWYLVPPLGWLAWRRLRNESMLHAQATLLGLAFSVIVFVYFFTSRAEVAVDFTQHNRAILHLVPLLVFTLVWVWDRATLASHDPG